MYAPASKREKLIVGTLLVVLSVICLISCFELIRSFITPEALSGLIGGEGPAADRCSYRTLASYRISNSLLAGLSLCAISLSLPIAAAKQRLSLLAPILVLTASFGFWYDWGCRVLGSAIGT